MKTLRNFSLFKFMHLMVKLIVHAFANLESYYLEIKGRFSNLQEVVTSLYHLWYRSFFT